MRKWSRQATQPKNCPKCALDPALKCRRVGSLKVLSPQTGSWQDWGVGDGCTWQMWCPGGPQSKAPSLIERSGGAKPQNHQGCPETQTLSPGSPKPNFRSWPKCRISPSLQEGLGGPVTPCSSWEVEHRAGSFFKPQVPLLWDAAHTVCKRFWMSSPQRNDTCIRWWLCQFYTFIPHQNITLYTVNTYSYLGWINNNNKQQK